jgi:hypothetical protein
MLGATMTCTGRLRAKEETERCSRHREKGCPPEPGEETGVDSIAHDFAIGGQQHNNITIKTSGGARTPLITAVMNNSRIGLKPAKLMIRRRPGSRSAPNAVAGT